MAYSCPTSATGRPRSSTCLFVVCLMLNLLGSALAPRGIAAEAVVPVPMQTALILRILEYDRALRSWAAPTLTLGIVGKEGGQEPLRRELVGHSAQGVTLEPVMHAYLNSASLGRWIDAEGVRLLYLSPDLAAEAEEICSLATQRHVPVVALTRTQFKAGGTIGITLKDGRPHILVSLPSSRAAGMDLDPKLLQLAEVVR